MTHPSSEGHIILVPLSIHGHVNPFMHLARRLLKRGLSCTLVIQKRGRWCLERILRESPIEEDHLFHVEWVSSPVGDTSFMGFDGWQQKSEPFFKTLVEDRAKGAKGPHCIIADQFAGWTSTWAAQLNVKRYFYICSPILFAYWAYNLPTLIKRDRILDRVDENPVLDLPGAPEFHLSDSADFQIVVDVFLATGASYGDAAGLLINSFHDVEGSVAEHFLSQLRSATGRDSKKRERPQWVLPIGPVVSGIGESIEFEPKDSAKDSPCIRWLDSRPSRDAVVYIAFGSVHDNDISKEQIWELAVALEAAEVSFLWVLLPRNADDVSHYAEASTLLPPGFQERVKDRGLVFTEFAPQPQILSHPATGTFITHCGWNSTLEGISRGMPMIGWPRTAEQRTCYLLLRSAGFVGHVRYGKEGEEILVKSAELEKVIRTWALGGAERTQLERAALRLQRQALAAIAPGGSSNQNFEKFVQEITPS